MDYRKIAERLVDYKISRGENIPIYDLNENKCDSCDSCPLFKYTKEKKEAWINDLEIIVKRRHSKFGLIRKLSRLK